MRSQAARDLAVQALGYIADDQQRLERFLALSGLQVEHVREAAQAPEFLVGVLDYLLGDERALLAFATINGVEPVAVRHARAELGDRDFLT